MLSWKSLSSENIRRVSATSRDVSSRPATPRCIRDAGWARSIPWRTIATGQRNDLEVWLAILTRRTNPPFPLHLRNCARARTYTTLPVRYLHGTPRTARRIPPAFTHPRTYVRRILALLALPSPYFPHMHSAIRGTRKRASRFAPLTHCTGCYNEGDVTSGISGADREEEARSVGW